MGKRDSESNLHRLTAEEFAHIQVLRSCSKEHQEDVQYFACELALIRSKEKKTGIVLVFSKPVPNPQ